MTSPKDAAAILSEVAETRTFIRLLARRGGLPDLLAIIAAQGLGSFVDPRRLDYGVIRIGFGAAAVVLATVMVVQAIQHRRRLGGDIGVPTAVTAGVVFVGNVLAYQTLHGDARESVRGALLGGGLLVLAAAYRSAPLLLAAGVLGLLVPATLSSWPLLIVLIPMAVWVAAVVLVLHTQLKEQLTL